MLFYSSFPSRAGLCATLCVATLFSTRADSQTMIKAIDRFVPADAIANNLFGRSIAFDGNLILVGATFDDVGASNSGSVYIFDMNTGQQLFKLTAPVGATNDWFGRSIAIYEDFIVIGAENDDELGEDSGAVYLFNATTGEFIEKILPVDALPFNRFGYSVDLNEHYIIIGSPSDDNIAFDAGSVYLYDKDSFEFVTKFQASDTVASDNFGVSVTVYENTLAVGAFGADPNGSGSGAVYLFDLQTMSQTYKLVPSGIDGGDFAGDVLSISDGIVAIGVPLNDEIGSNAGAVYLFDTNTGAELHKLIASDGSADDRFGTSVAIESSTVIVSARKYDFDSFPYQEPNAGTAYIFDTTTGQQLARLVPGDIEDSANDFFGESVAIKGGVIVVGALSDNEHNSAAGAVHAFTIQGLDFADNAYFPSDVEFPDQFGHSVSIDGERMVVGAPFDQSGGSSRGGAAYIFDTSTGQMLHKVTPDDGRFNAQFGRSVAIDGDLVVMGAPLDFYEGIQSAGSAYLYNAIAGDLIYKLYAQDAQAADLFGHSVAIDSGIIVVGAYAEDENGSNSGAAYTFDATTGQQLTKLLADDGFANDQFGTSVAIDNGIVVVGSIFSDPGPSNTGAAYLFNANTGQQLFKLIAEDRWASDQFGKSVAINNNIVAVGAPGDDIGFTNSGSAYLFDASTGVQIAKLVPSDPASVAQFGWSVALNDNKVVVGIRRPETPEVSQDKAYLFDLKSQQQIAILLPTDGTLGDRFGTAVAMTNDIIAVGASNEYDRSNDSGTAYTFSVSSPVCSADYTNDGVIDFFDVSLFLTLFGAQDPAADLTNDGIYDFFDFSVFLQLYFAGCP